MDTSETQAYTFPSSPQVVEYIDTYIFKDLNTCECFFYDKIINIETHVFIKSKEAILTGRQENDGKETSNAPFDKFTDNNLVIDRENIINYRPY